MKDGEAKPQAIPVAAAAVAGSTARSSDQPAQALTDPGLSFDETVSVKNEATPSGTRRVSGQRPADDEGCRRSVSILRKVVLGLDKLMTKTSKDSASVKMYDDVADWMYSISKGPWASVTGAEAVANKMGKNGADPATESGADASIASLRMMHSAEYELIIAAGINPGATLFTDVIQLLRQARSTGSFAMTEKKECRMMEFEISATLTTSSEQMSLSALVLSDRSAY